ncbi:hypothetical protein, partial [Kitasatospora indigofera]|uniref:hypothetical protein n=1 Tax=Kitasatospora indigofera TaxID=67307 RepID=UPI0036C976BE
MFMAPAATPARYAAAVQAIALPVLRSAPTVRQARVRGAVSGAGVLRPGRTSHPGGQHPHPPPG